MEEQHALASLVGRVLQHRADLDSHVEVPPAVAHDEQDRVARAGGGHRLRAGVHLREGNLRIGGEEGVEADGPQVVAHLLREGELSATELADALDLPSNTLHYHLDKLVDVGLVANRKRKERGADGPYSYYVATSMGEAVMRDGIGELIRREWEALERYE